MICPKIKPEPCPDPEACQTGAPCNVVLAMHDFYNDKDFAPPDKVRHHLLLDNHLFQGEQNA